MMKRRKQMSEQTYTEDLIKLRATAIAAAGIERLREAEDHCIGGRHWRDHMKEIYEAVIAFGEWE
jgi:hypothetical protein